MGKVLLGFTVPEGKPYKISLHHTVITGMTDLSGKTTTVEAILLRGNSKRKCLVFLTKRGEKTFVEGRRIAPFYQERFDWEYMRGLLEASMKERLKFETPWIIRICKLARAELRRLHPEDPELKNLPVGEGLGMVRQLLVSTLKKEKLRELDRNMFTLLLAYLDKVIPVLQQASRKFTRTWNLKLGLNVMDLTDWYTQEEVQMLVIRSCMEFILKHENNNTVALPEAWKMLPQSRNTPVKLYFEKFIREGATNGNYLFIDAQDLGGVDKTPLRQVSVWIMGKMMEANEVERLIKQTLGLKVPAREIQTLQLGHFMVAAKDTVQKVYVWPHGVPEEMAIAVAKGNLKPETIQEFLIDKFSRAEIIKKTLGQPGLSKISDFEKRLDATNKRLDGLDAKVTSALELYNAEIIKIYEKLQDFRTIAETITSKTFEQHANNVEATLEQTTFNVQVTAKAKDFKLTDESMDGKVMRLAKEGFLGTWHSEPEIRRRIREEGWAVTANITLYNALQKLVKCGFLGKMKKGSIKYKLSPNVNFVGKVEK